MKSGGGGRGLKREDYFCNIARDSSIATCRVRILSAFSLREPTCRDLIRTSTIAIGRFS